MDSKSKIIVSPEILGFLPSLRCFCRLSKHRKLVIIQAKAFCSWIVVEENGGCL